MTPRLLFFTLLIICGLQAQLMGETKEIEAAELEQSYWDKAKRLYDEKVKDNEIPTQVKEAAQKDLKKVGGWAYLVLEIEGNDPSKLTEFLNEAGDNLWECFFVQPKNHKSTLFYFNRNYATGL